MGCNYTHKNVQPNLVDWDEKAKRHGLAFNLNILRDMLGNSHELLNCLEQCGG